MGGVKAAWVGSALAVAACGRVPAGAPGAQTIAQTIVIPASSRTANMTHIKVPAAGMCPHVPPAKDAAVPPAPVSGFPQVLEPGHWEWDDGGYQWVAARWLILVSHRRPLWIDGAWQPSGAACVWRRGQFSHPPGVPDAG